MFILYDLIFFIFALVYLPLYALRKKFHQGFSRRLGFLPGDLGLNRPIWIHAVSVGEAMAVKGLVETLREIFPDKRFVISTVTPTGNKVARSMGKDGDFVTYLPLDFSFIVRRVINRLAPCLFVIAETELWPNLIRILFRKKIPIVVVNARISDASFKGYRLIKFLLKPLLNKISVFCVQSKLDAERLLRLGVAVNKVQITGNMKFDVKPHVLSFDNLHLRLAEDEELLVCGSTHSGEEEVILGAYKNLLDKFPKLKLLIVPRHPERAKVVEKLISESGFEAVFISSLERATHNAERPMVFVLDTIGQLLNYYAIADIVFVGGSLVAIGGHNILEPASQGKPVIFGTHMFNFRDIADLFLKNRAALQVHGQRELEEEISRLLSDPKLINGLTSRARALIAQNQGATLHNSQIIKKVYAGISL